MKRIGLCMIVKDEADLILRCLESARPLVDYVLVCDTGSSDGTQKLIAGWLKCAGILGFIINEPWLNFAHNRSSALRHLKSVKHIDYALVIDADDQLVFDEGFDLEAFKSSLTDGLYNVDIVLGELRYPRAQLLSNRLDFRYRGVLHEFVEGPRGQVTGNAKGFHILAGVEGSRSRNPTKYRDDAALLERALETEEWDFLRARYTFYLAQSWKDAGDPETALGWYLKRTTMTGGMHQEIFVSYYRTAQIEEQLSWSGTEVIGAYLRAYEQDPARAEPLQAAVRYCHRNGKYHQGYLIGKHALTIPEPEGKLFAEPWIYRYGLLDDFAIAAYWSGHYEESFAATTKLLTEDRAPEHEVARVTANRNFAEEKLAQRS